LGSSFGVRAWVYASPRSHRKPETHAPREPGEGHRQRKLGNGVVPPQVGVDTGLRSPTPACAEDPQELAKDDWIDARRRHDAPIDEPAERFHRQAREHAQRIRGVSRARFTVQAVIGRDGGFPERPDLALGERADVVARRDYVVRGASLAVILFFLLMMGQHVPVEVVVVSAIGVPLAALLWRVVSRSLGGNGIPWATQ
jgi:hypothetical protein